MKEALWKELVTSLASHQRDNHLPAILAFSFLCRLGGREEVLAPGCNVTEGTPEWLHLCALHWSWKYASFTRMSLMIGLKQVIPQETSLVLPIRIPGLNCYQVLPPDNENGGFLQNYYGLWSRLIFHCFSHWGLPNSLRVLELLFPNGEEENVLFCQN